MKTIAICLLLASCATQPERYLTADEDAALRKNCEPAGCVSVPIPIFEKIMQILKAIGSTRI